MKRLAGFRCTLSAGTLEPTIPDRFFLFQLPDPLSRSSERWLSVSSLMSEIAPFNGIASDAANSEVSQMSRAASGQIRK